MAMAKAKTKSNAQPKSKSKKKNLSVNELYDIAVDKRVAMVYANGNDYEKDSFISKLIEGCGLSSTIPIVFTLEEDISYIASFLNTRSLIYDGCVIELQYNIKTLSKKTKFNKKTDTIGNILSKILETKYDKHLVILLPSSSDKRNVLQKKCDTDYCYVEFETPTEKQMVSFVKKYVKSLDDFSMTDDAIDTLLSMTLNDYYAVQSEIDKLSITYNNVNSKIVHDNVYPTSEVVVFDIIEAICKNHVIDAYKKMNAYIENGGNYFAFMSLISRNFHYMYYAKVLKTKFASVTKQPVFLANKYIEYSKYYSERKLVAVMEGIIETEFLLKTGNDNQNVIYKLLGMMV